MVVLLRIYSYATLGLMVAVYVLQRTLPCLVLLSATLFLSLLSVLCLLRSHPMLAVDFSYSPVRLLGVART